MNCHKIEEKLREIVKVLLILGAVGSVPLLLIATAIADGHPWWLYLAIVLGVVGVITAFCYIVAWIEGDVSICRRK